MTGLEYVIYRYLHTLIEAAIKRDLTRHELRFIQRMRPWIARVQRQELDRR